MSTLRLALANLRFPATPEESIVLARNAVERAAREGAALIAFPECFVPGYRDSSKGVPPPDAAFLERAWSVIAEAAGRAKIAVVLGTERLAGETLFASALVIAPDGTRVGFQDKVQIDPSEVGLYTPGCDGRRVFTIGELTFGVVICHEGWRYPETVRYAARRGAQVVFHLQYHAHEPGTHRPTTFGEPANTFHEKAILCRAAENTCYFASVNFASAGSPTTSAVARPDGTLLAHQPYGEEGLLIADIELAAATRLLASRFKPIIPERAAPIFSVRDVAASLEHYRKLGFTAHAYRESAVTEPVYGFIELGPIELHLARVRDLDPAKNTSACYLYVEDAGALHRAWSRAGAGGRLTTPEDTEYDLREFAHVDPDGNLLRVGSPIFR